MNTINYNKYLKYKSKYNNLKKQIGGETQISIIESNSDSSILSYIGAGVPNIVYFDSNLRVIIKIRKNSYKDSRISFVNIPNSFEEKTTILTSDDSITSYLRKFESTNVNINFEVIKNYIDSSKIINMLPTFLKFKGIIIYNNIGVNRNYNVETPLVVPSFEYLDGVDSLYNFGPTLKDEMIAIIKDFKIFNSSGYTHGDLENNCRNIISYNDKGTKKLKVIDLEDPINFINDGTALESLIRVLLQDYISLNKCLINLNLLTIISNKIDICSLIRSLDFDITVLDTTTYSKDNIYPKYKLTLSEWIVTSDGYKIIGTYDTDKMVNILINNNYIERFENIKVVFKNCSYCILNINLLNNREKIKTFIESIYDSLIGEISV